MEIRISLSIGVLVAAMAIVASGGCGPSPIEKRLADAAKQKAAQQKPTQQKGKKTKPADKRRGEQHTPPANGMWDQGVDVDKVHKDNMRAEVKNQLDDAADNVKPLSELAQKIRSRPRWPATTPPEKGWYGRIELPFERDGAGRGVEKTSFSHSLTILPLMVLEDISRAPINKETPVYVERFPDGKISAVVMLNRGTTKIEGWVATFFEGGAPEFVAKYAGGLLDGPLRLYDEKTGDLLLYAEFRIGRPRGLRIILDHEWPLYVQQWNGTAAKDECMIVKDYAIDVDSLAGSLHGMPEIAAQLRRRSDSITAKAIELETELRRAVREWVKDVIDSKKKESVRISGPAKRGAIMRDAQQVDSANAAAFNQEWNQAIEQLRPRLLGK